ncbi:hypothetical protein PVL29_017786 [Vitis rotundifolia]|uniref:Disease resistance RPP13-like protein 1 n=1 Tax=Vitis rotundifolia TaxID=103349 RepID=A0AA38ZBL8_VITRO|nr:hypothetical protein PVL29_017786 [Vitis rotundifolia]
MADALLSASLQVLFDRLASPELVNFIRGQKLSHELLNKLNRKLLVVHKVLNDAEMKQFSNPLVKDWLVQVKDAVYHAEDLLDEIATEALRCEIEASDSQARGTHHAWNWEKVSAWVKAPFANQSMESRVKEMSAKLEDIAEEKEKLGLKEGEGDKLSPRPPSTSLVDESSVYGRNEIKEEMVKWLLSDKENATGNNVDVMSIVGMGGSGKTTLAQLLYNHDTVEQHFHLKAWVCVSTEIFLIEEVTKSILQEISSETKSNDTLNLLQLKLKERVGNKKFLLVLDDVWDMKSLDWEGLRIPLLTAAEGSKIVVTSRSETAAKIMRAVPTHHLETLSTRDSWSLFKKLAFPNGNSSAYPQLEPIGRKIVDKCQGLPLAVKALGSLLYFKAEKREWEDILNSETWNSQTDHEILPSLRLSYQHLSPLVKRCFAYCSIFPKDYEFHKEKLILLWMAEGLLHSGQSNRRMEEVGDSYFNELLAKSFFQKCIREEESCFVMHDLIHDLAQHISQEFCIRLEDCKLQKISDKARHFLHFKSDDHWAVVFETFEPVDEAKHLRTFLEVKRSWRVPVYKLSQRVLQNILPKFKSLRVLSLCEYTITDVPDSIHNLKQLRYLDLSTTEIERLPESICCLCNLQTMMLSNCRSLLELPSKMGRLINLRYLDVSGTDSLKEMPNDIDQLKSLQKLPNFTVGQKSGFRFGELWKLSEIRGRLEISKMENVVGVEDASGANIKDKKYLDELSLNWSGGISHDAIQDDILNRLTPHPNLKRLSIGGYPGLTFPDWLGDGSLSNLVSLQLSNCGNCSTLPPLGQLPCLEHIKISEMSGVVMVGSEFYGNSSSSLHPSFPSLQTLIFQNMSNWEKWLCCGGICGEFPRLQELSIRLCPKLTGELPMHLSSLQELNLKDCPQLLVPTLNVPAARVLQLKRQTCGFTASQTSEIEISDVSQLKQLPVVPHNLYIRKCDSVESLLEEEILQTNIHDLYISDCSFLRSLYKVGLPTTLKSLSISNCTKVDLLLPELFRCHHPVLENLSIKGGTYGNSLPLSFSILDIFPRLTDFQINDLEGLVELCISISEGDPTSLRRLRIERCPNLVYIQLPALDSMRHEIWNCSKLRILRLLAHTHSSLQKLCLQGCPELLLHREGLPSNLRELEIRRCNQLTSQVDWDLQRLTSLTHLVIEGGCEGVELFPKECLLPSSLTCLSINSLPNLKSLDSKGLQQLTSLQRLYIVDCPELQFSTGSVLQRLISLKVLQIWSCGRLQSLTEAGLHHLTTLESLSISSCPRLQYLTKERLPDSLCHLHVRRCPSLGQRLQFEKGQEWRYISHIRAIVIDVHRIKQHRLAIPILNFGFNGPLTRRNFKESCKEDCFCAIAIYADNVLAEEISSVLWKTQQNYCRQAQIRTITAKVDAYYGCTNGWSYEWFVQRKLACWWKLMNDMKRLERLVMVAIWCIQEDAALRSTMRKVTQMLEGVVEVSVPPRPFGIFITLQTSEIEISNVSQLKQLPVVPHNLSPLRSMILLESPLEEEILQTNMYSLEFCDCSSFYGSPSKGGLPTTLKSLLISNCTKLDLLLPELFRCHHPILENLSINGGTYDNSLLLSFSILDISPRLTNFTINGLKGLEKLYISISEGDPTSLRKLEFKGCADLVYIQLPALDSRSHEIHNCSKLKLLAHTHSSLQKLSLMYCPELLFHTEGLPSSLRELQIWFYNRLTSQVDWDLQRLTSLTHFAIFGGCEDVELFPKQCLLPSSPTFLAIYGLPNLKSLDSKGLQQLTSLVKLDIRKCPELQSLTGSVLQRLVSLKELQSQHCPRLQSLTEAGLHYLTTLEILHIHGCREFQYLTRKRLSDSLSCLIVDRCPLLKL